MPIDLQKRMKIQAELAYTNERLAQIRANLEDQGYNKFEYDSLLKKRDDLMNQLNV